MLARRTGHADRAEPAVLVSGMPVATIAAPYAVAGCAFVPPGGNGPCVTGQWIVGADAGAVAGPAARHHDRHFDLRADRDADAAGSSADTGSRDVRSKS